MLLSKKDVIRLHFHAENAQRSGNSCGAPPDGLRPRAAIHNIAPSKAWEGGIPCERMKPFKRIQLVKVQSTDKRFYGRGCQEKHLSGERAASTETLSWQPAPVSVETNC